MKKIITAALLSFALTGANANVIFSDDFDSEAPNQTSVLNYAGFTNWTVTDGTVDLVANGEYSIYCVGNTGKCVDLDGSTGNAGIFTSSLFNLAAGNYVLSFDVSGNQRNQDNDSMVLTLGGFVSDSIQLAGNAPWQTVSYFFTVGTAGSNSISFNHSGGDNIGIMLDNVSVTDVNAPGALALLGLGLTGLAIRRRKQKSI